MSPKSGGNHPVKATPEPGRRTRTISKKPLPSPALLMMGDVIKANGYAQQLADQTLASYPVIAQA